MKHGHNHGGPPNNDTHGHSHGHAHALKSNPLSLKHSRGQSIHGDPKSEHSHGHAHGTTQRQKEQILNDENFSSESIDSSDDNEEHHCHVPRDTVVDLAYTESRYSVWMSPMIIYIPSKLLMLKMMKSCLGCNSVNDLFLCKREQQSS
jgi:hypothetical protein